MSEVCIEGPAEREVGGVVVDGVVDGRVRGGEVLVLEAREEFLQVANTLGAASRVAEGVVIIV